MRPSDHDADDDPAIRVAERCRVGRHGHGLSRVGHDPGTHGGGEADAEELLADQIALESFYREARACARLNHTNIVHIYAFDEWEGQQYLVMELADRGSLDARIEKLRLLSELDMLDIGIKIASALDMALKYDLLHRDIKPGNILFNADHEPKLVDFGLARKADVEHEVEDVTWGTPYYVAPEKIKREPETFLSDMYSLGATLYHGMTGHVPFDAPTVEEVIVAQVQTPLTPRIWSCRNHATHERCADQGDGEKSGGTVLELRRIHHGARAGPQPSARDAVSNAAASKVQKPHQLVEAAMKKAGVAARLEDSKNSG